MPDHEDSLGGETFGDDAKSNRAERSLGDGATMSGDTASHSVGEQSTFGDANVDDELFDDGMELVDLSTRYSEESVLGKGGMGEVILATDTRLGRKVAIKRILGKAARSKTAVQRFLTEAKSMAELNHPNIVQIHDYGRSADGPFLIMECVRGGSLQEKCKAGPIELDDAVNIFSQLCDGLAKAHAAGIIHRDIKPANVLMTEDDVPKLTDFGLAKDDAADTGMTVEGAVIGTLDFMSPEQRQSAELVDHRSDLWSLAATFYQILSGKSPKVINISSIPPKLQSVVAKALEESKDDRFQSAHEMREKIILAHSGKMDTSRSLGEGECPQCATRNPPDRKFCRECSAQLQVNCLGCQNGMAIWDKACGECGAQQSPLVDSALADLKTAHDRAESLLADLKFDEAAEHSEVVGSETDSRLQQYATWREDFSVRLESSRKSEHARLEELLREALTHEQAYDYEAGLQTLKQVAPSLKQTTVSGIDVTAFEINEQLTTKQSRFKELEVIVRGRVTKRDIGGLLQFVNELLFLKPDHPNVLKLRAQLEKRESQLDVRNQQIISQAQSHMHQSQFDAAVKILDTIAPEYQTSTTVALRQQAAAEYRARAPITNTFGIILKPIPAGTFMMGSPADEKDRRNEEQQHEVTISKSFYLQVTEVTQAQWKYVMNSEPWKGKQFVKEGANYPAVHVSWDDAVAFCKTISSKEGKTYRLPTEAEWEYACRAVTETAWSFGHDKNQTFDYAFCGMNTWKSWKRYSQQVGLKKPNAFGLYDMHGNVWEWCHDYFFKGYYIQSPSKDPMGPTSGSLRALRGGSWRDKSHFTRSACRGRNDAVYRSASVGFRLVREMD